MNKQARKEQAIKYLKQLDIYKPYIDGFEKDDQVCVFERYAGFWVHQYPELERKMRAIEKEYGCKPIIYLGSFCCWKVIPTVYDCPIWLRFLKVYHIIPNTTIKQAAIVDNLDRNYCKDIDAIVLKK